MLTQGAGDEPAPLFPRSILCCFVTTLNSAWNRPPHTITSARSLKPMIVLQVEGYAFKALIMYTFHPLIKSNYISVNQWLSSRLDRSYKSNSALKRAKNLLEDQTLESAALQYYVFFPTHCSKVGFALEHMVGASRLADWLKYTKDVVVIDVGCGAGAGSVAFLNCLLNLYESGGLQSPVTVHFVGIDPNDGALAVYSQQLNGLKSGLEKFGIHLAKVRLVEEEGLQAVTAVREYLVTQRGFLNVPFLGHVFLFQANVVSPFSKRHSDAQSKRRRLTALGIPEDELGDLQEVFGREEAVAYKQILEDSFIDNLHVITVGTRGHEQQVVELAEAIDIAFQGNQHVVQRLGGGQQEVEYEVIDGSYWKDFRSNLSWTSTFHVEVSSISSVALADPDWQEIKSTQNLQTAWARARRHLLEQPLVDEVEIRLFESRLEHNISRLQEQLVAYAQDVVHSDDRLHFKFPKNSEKVRPLGLSRIEEEILSTALIQKLGQRISGITSKSYAYKFSRNYGVQHTEYLYDNWFDAYRTFMGEAHAAAQSNPNCIIVQTDIKSFFERIIRDNLLQLSTEQFGQSPRIAWLLKLLFSRDLDEHEAGKGIVQGNLASGFFANLYLIDLDARFGSNNEWKAKFFRYVDDR